MDAVADVADDVLTDAIDASDASTCDALLATANAALATAGTGCKGLLDCRRFEFPICGSFGCFRRTAAMW